MLAMVRSSFGLVGERSLAPPVPLSRPASPSLDGAIDEGRVRMNEASAAVRSVNVGESGLGSFGQIVVSGRHVMGADESERAGGRDTGPDPYDYLCIALGACTSMTIRLYVERKKWPLRRVSVT